jgi:uncharacterized phiE125 gp8 family phage protein
MSLDTLANVKTRLGVSSSADDGLLSALMDSADDFVAGYCGRDFGGGTFTEYHSGDSPVVVLRNYPVQTLTSVKVDPSYGFGAETLRPATSYVVHADRGVIQSLIGPFLPTGCPVPALATSPWQRAPRVVQVVYSTATSAVPADVRQAYTLLIGHWYRHVKTQIASGFQNVLRQSAGGVTVTFARDQIAGGVLPADLPRLLGPYRTPLL